MPTRAFFLCFSAVLVTLASPAWAQPSPADRAAAEALFDQAIKLMESGKPEAACPKLEESQRLDPGVGTLLYLADCYQNVGRTASAWATFREAAYAARSAGQSDREATAKEYAERIKPNLSYVTLKVEGKDIAGLEIKQDGQVIRRALWGTAVPTDPGAHRLEASAPGKEAWSQDVEVPKGPAQTEFEIPTLTDAPQDAVASNPGGETTGVATTKPTNDPMADTGSSGGGAQRTLGWISLGVGAAGLVVAGVFSLGAIADDDAANSDCLPSEPTLCNGDGLDKADSAAQKALFATISGGVGLTAAGLGVILLMTAPDDATAFRVAPSVGQGSAGVVMRGSF